MIKFKQVVVKVLVALFVISCSSKQQAEENPADLLSHDTIMIWKEAEKYFDSCLVKGTIIIYDNLSRKWIVSDTTSIHEESLPASTFKIINLLIALETKVIADEKEIIKWVGSTDTVKYGYRPEIYHDISVEEAFKVSAGWAFVELAKRIGKERYKDYLSRCSYGNSNLSQADTDFWNFGAFGISPLNQVLFLKALYEEKLPFSKRNMAIVKRVMLAEQTPEYSISAKTGWTRESNRNTGWWIGFIETPKGVYFFATRLLQDRKLNRDDFGSCRKTIARRVFEALNILKSG